MRALICTIVFLLASFSVFCQTDTSKTQKTKSLKISTLAIASKGDVASTYNKWNIGSQWTLMLNQQRRFSGSFSLFFGSTSQQKRNYEISNSTITPTNYVKCKLSGLYYDLQLRLINKQKVSLSIAQGIGLLRFIPLDEYGNKLIDQYESREEFESYETVSTIFPRRIILQYKFLPFLSASYSLSSLSPSTDYIDNVSNLGTQKGNDKVIFHNFGLVVLLNTSQKQ